MQNLRSFLLIALAMCGFLLWQEWQTDYPATPAPAAVSTSDAPAAAASADVPGEPAASDAPDVPDVSAAPDAPPVAAPASDAAASTSDAPRVTVTTDVLRVVIDTQGGSVVEADLLAYPEDAKRKDRPVRLLRNDALTVFVAQSGLVASAGAAPDHRARYQAAATSYQLGDAASVVVPLTWTDASGVTVTKRFTFERGSYAIGVQHELRNAGSAPWTGSAYRQLQRTPSASVGFSLTNPEAYSFVGAAWWSPEERFEKLAFDDFLDSDPPLPREIVGGWAAMLQHYFFAAWIPPKDEKDAYTIAKVGEAAPRYLIRQMAPAITVAPGANARFDARLYAGPKLQGKLDALAAGLEDTIDYGKVTVISEPLFALLAFLHKLVGNWGWAIVLITVLVKLVLYPLSEAQYRSMAKMRKLQPRLAALKERYGDDKQKYNQAMMELYQKEKINPMGGCLPILVQIPVFIALYWVLLESVELRQAPFILWIDNLSVKDPYFVLPILNGLAMWAGQKLSPAVGMDPMQQKLMQMMPIIFSVMFAFFPAGLVLYWTVNGVLSLAQQYVITKRVEAQGSKTKG